MLTVGLALAAYLLGSVPFAVLVSRAFGLADPRTYGSGNPGATNVLRSGSKAAAALTLLGDAVKGWVAVWATQALAPTIGASEADVAVVGVAAFLGHVFSVFLKLQGGKGVATAAGVLIGFDPWIGLAVVGVWLAVAAIFRYSSLAALAAGLAAPFAFLKVHGAGAVFIAVTAMSAVLIVRHAENLRRLIAGKESRIGSGKRAQAGDKS